MTANISYNVSTLSQGYFISRCDGSIIFPIFATHWNCLTMSFSNQLGHGSSFGRISKLASRRCYNPVAIMRTRGNLRSLINILELYQTWQTTRNIFFYIFTDTKNSTHNHPRQWITLFCGENVNIIWNHCKTAKNNVFVIQGVPKGAVH